MPIRRMYGPKQGGSRQFDFGGSKYSNNDVIMTSHYTNPPNYWGVRGPPGPPTDYPPVSMENLKIIAVLEQTLKCDFLGVKKLRRDFSSATLIKMKGQQTTMHLSFLTFQILPFGQWLRY